MAKYLDDGDDSVANDDWRTDDGVDLDVLGYIVLAAEGGVLLCMSESVHFRRPI